MTPWMRAVSMMGLCVVCLGSVAHGEVSVKTYQTFKNDAEMKRYIQGLGAGFVWMNIYLGKARRRPVFCLPEHLSLYEENFKDILDKAIQRQGIAPDGNIELVLLDGLKRTFPCK